MQNRLEALVRMQFLKVHGAGNDFVLLPDLDDRLDLDEPLVRALCDRHRGVGGDGVIRLGRGAADADAFMDYRNADGSVVEMCGNGVRCVAKYMVDRGLVAGDVVRVGTRGGVKVVEVVGRHPDGSVATVRVNMGAPVPTGTLRMDVSPMTIASAPTVPAAPSAPGETPAVTAEQREVEVVTLSMGNPHAVVLVGDVAVAPVATWGPYLERHEMFPDRTNVEFIAVVDPGRVEGRIWERGVGETMASGTGGSAMAVAAHLLGLTGRQVTVCLPGGELEVDWTADTLFVTGPAEEVAEGRLDEAWVAGARAKAVHR